MNAHLRPLAFEILSPSPTSSPLTHVNPDSHERYLRFLKDLVQDPYTRSVVTGAPCPQSPPAPCRRFPPAPPSLAYPFNVGVLMISGGGHQL